MLEALLQIQLKMHITDNVECVKNVVIFGVVFRLQI